jgi:hypothetical protein
MLERTIFEELEEQYGPFDWDACCDEDGHNGHQNRQREEGECATSAHAMSWKTGEIARLDGWT